MLERRGEAFEFDEQLTVIGEKLSAGDAAPDFSLDWLNPDTGHIETVTLGGSAGNVRIINVVNSIDTPVCQIETRQWDRLQKELPENVEVLTITMDLPFAIDRWATSESISHKGLSSHRSEQFGTSYGTLIREWRMLQRAVFVVDGEGTIVHAEYVADQMREPDYDAAIAAATRAVK